MKISLNWLKDYVEFAKELTPEDIAWRLTEATAEIEGVQHRGEDLEHVVVGELVESKKHPEADKLFVGKVKISPQESIQVVYGQKAVVKIGDKIPTAIAPCQLHGGKVEKGEIRGVESEGMLCLDSELLEGASETLTIFPAKTKVGTAITKLLPLKDAVFEIDNHSITHRADLFSHYGFARECVALGLAKWKKQLKLQDVAKVSGKKKLPLTVKVTDDQISKNYFGTVIQNVSTKAAPDWMRYRLGAVGIRSINAIVDVTNYIMMDVGQPNHAFDLRALEGKTFVNRLSKQGEKVTTLDGVERMLEKDIIIAETENGIVDLAGIMGGADSEIKEDTTDVYFHSVQFNNVLIRRAMISLGHRTDGGTMHEKDIEAERSQLGYVRGLELFQEVFPDAKIEHECAHLQKGSSPEISVKLPFAKVSTHIGIEIDPKLGKQYLEDLGFEVKLGKNEYQVKVPSWRSNSVSIPEDVVEEIVRIHGFSQVPATPPTIELATPVRNHKRHTKRTLQKFLTSLGFQEEVNFSFTSQELLEKAGCFQPETLIEIANPVSEDFRFMRPNFLPYMLRNLYASGAEESIWRRFETGAVYKRQQEEVSEKHLLTVLVAGNKKEQLLANMKRLTEDLFKELSLGLETEISTSEFAYPNRCLRVLCDNEALGQVYQVHPALLERFKIKQEVAVLEIDLDRLYQAEPSDVHYQQINRLPKAHLDLSVVVEKETLYQEVEKVLHSVHADKLQEAELVDVYQGENLGKDKKSLTFALSYQHPERTLDESEIQDILDELISAVEKAGGTIRR